MLSVLTVDVDGEINPANTSSVLAPGRGRLRLDRIGLRRHHDLVRPRTRSTPPANRSSRTSPPRSIASTSRSDTSAAYTASGSVDGLIRDSFSFSEHDGHLRVVTTTGNNWDETSESFVRVLQEDDGELVEVGSVGDMGNGEAVQSVRFQGDIGYVVTFRQVDPLLHARPQRPDRPRGSW